MHRAHRVRQYFSADSPARLNMNVTIQLIEKLAYYTKKVMPVWCSHEGTTHLQITQFSIDFKNFNETNLVLKMHFVLQLLSSNKRLMQSEQ
jgi:hypothetical protein